MKKLLIFAGTTEGRMLATRLAEEGVYCVVSVATEYGEQVMLKSEHIKVQMGRLTVDQMQELYKSNEYMAVVDATHPFATVVTENIKESLAGTGIPYFRLAREIEAQNLDTSEKCVFFDNAGECAKALESIHGNIFLTTGSKDLNVFCSNEELKQRLVVRVLPGRESIELCYQNGLEGKQIIAMQGPFSKEMNLATIRQYNISCLVTKESGKTGGVDEKVQAALEEGISCFMIRKPEAKSDTKEYSFIELLCELEKLTGIPMKKHASLKITLAGIGMGDEATQTLALHKALQNTDYLFGAERMIEGLNARKGKYPYYLAKDIIPCLNKLQQECQGEINVTILYSGDTGFYSGCSKMYKELQNLEQAKITILPGISSLSAFCAKIGESWQDANIISAHGTDEDKWIAELLYGIRHEKKTFFLTSGPSDIQRVGVLLKEYGYDKNVELFVGYQLSYPNQKVMKLTAEECAEVTEPGLYVGFIKFKSYKSSNIDSAIENTVDIDRYKNPESIGAGTLSCVEGNCVDILGNFTRITPGFSDEIFTRGKVPMTKEEVREISICKLGLKRDSIVYDVGSGTGSIALEMAALSPNIKVYAIETNPEALDLIKENKRKLGLFNIEVIEALAPDGLEACATPTHAFIGGSKGNLNEILEALYQKNPHMRIVMNAISLESIAGMQEAIKKFPVKDVDIASVSVAKAKEVGAYHLMQANNPVMIFSFTFSEIR